jgi:glycosyltransferase involved in cell wall biosynthesis
MKLLILSFYYPPDLCAGSFRTLALTTALEKYSSRGVEVDLFTTQPNRYAELSNSSENYEDKGWLRINRIDLPTHQSGMVDQAKAFFVYATAVRSLTKNGDWDLVYATSSRLMTAVLGAYVSRKLSVPLYLDIRDIFTDTMKDVLNGSALRQLMPVFRWLERYSFKTATRLNVVSAGFLDHMRQINPNLKCSVFTNGIDGDFLTTNFDKELFCGELPLILYAGNIGEGQGLHRIIPGAAEMLNRTVRFRIIGNGGRLPQLKSALEISKITNVELQDSIPRNALMNEYKAADILFLHLNNYPAFRKVIPSKIFEYAATGKPIVAGVSGYAAEFLRQEIPDVQIFDPCDVWGMSRAVVSALKANDTTDRNAFCMTFNRTKIMDRLAADILSTPCLQPKHNLLHKKFIRTCFNEGRGHSFICWQRCKKACGVIFKRAYLRIKSCITK